MIGAVIWREEKPKRGAFTFFVLRWKKKKKKRIPRLKFPATFTHTNISTCTHARPIFFPP